MVRQLKAKKGVRLGQKLEALRRVEGDELQVDINRVLGFFGPKI
jgi:hypothetical protein